MLVPMGNTHNAFHDGGQKTHIGDDESDHIKTLCGIDAFLFLGPEKGIDRIWILTGGDALCVKCVKSALKIISEAEAAKRQEGE